MIKDIRDIAENEIDDIIGTVSGMANLQEDQEQFLKEELSKTFVNLAKLSYDEAMRDIKSSADKLTQQQLWQ